jgi:hypothetical protein
LSSKCFDSSFYQQPSQIYFLTARKVHLFGIQNEATREQTNYVLDESELLDKGSNGTLSLVFDAIKKPSKGERNLKLTCDNAVGQNKNNNLLRLCQYLIICGYYQTIGLNFMIAGHTKFKVDGNFGMIKRLYHKSTIYTKEQFEGVVTKSSSLNKVQCYKNGQGFQYFDFKVLEKHFHKLPNINRYHHFLFSADKLGVVKVKEFVNSSFEEFNLWKNEDESIEEIGNLVFPILMPKTLSFERQEYLCQN